MLILEAHIRHTGGHDTNGGKRNGRYGWWSEVNGPSPDVIVTTALLRLSLSERHTKSRCATKAACRLAGSRARDMFDPIAEHASGPEQHFHPFIFVVERTTSIRSDNNRGLKKRQ
jgi:hypothetical protein